MEKLLNFIINNYKLHQIIIKLYIILTYPIEILALFREKKMFKTQNSKFKIY